MEILLAVEQVLAGVSESDTDTLIDVGAQFARLYEIVNG
jgi:hypothetical protein